MTIVQVWWADVSDHRPHHLDLLDPVERARRARFVRPADRDRFTLGAAMTRLVLGTWVGLPPDRLALDRSCPTCGAPHGRPRLAHPPTPLRVSISHSGSRVVLAVTDRGEVGVDVEAIVPSRDIEALCDHVLTPSEAAEVRRLPLGEQVAAFLTYWTRKEAVLKARGEGLGVEPAQLTVSAPHEGPKLLAWPQRPGFPERVTLHALDPGPGHVACLALVDCPGRVEERSATGLLRGSREISRPGPRRSGYKDGNVVEGGTVADTETGSVTGTKDKDYNIIWFTEVCLSNVLRLETYIQDAEREGDNDLAEFFRRAQGESRKGAEQGKKLLAARLSG